MTEAEIFNTALRISVQNEQVFPISKFPWTRKEGVITLLKDYKNQREAQFVNDIISQLNDNIVDEVSLNDLLFEMAKLISRNEVSGSQTALVVMRQKGDPMSDSSQSVIDHLKVPLKISTTFNYGYCTTSFNDITSIYKRRNFRHFIVVDDFIGSGKTVAKRYHDFQSWKLQNSTIHFYFLAGMSNAIQFCRNSSIPTDCCKIMPAALSGVYSGEDLQNRVNIMKRLESKLASAINTLQLKDFTFGYNQAEALYCMKFGNIPNSVFPILWWNKDNNSNDRITIFTRVQDGF